MLRYALFLGCACVLIEAGTVQTVAAGTAPQELVGTWLVEDIKSGGVIDNLQTTLEIHDDGTYSGMAGCNNYTGVFTVKSLQISFAPAAATRKLCPPAVMDQEAKFFRALSEGLSYEFRGDELRLYAADYTVPLRMMRHDNLADLVLRIPAAPIDRSEVRYDCGGEPVMAEYINSGNISLLQLSIGDAVVVAANVVSGSGAKYMGGYYTWWTKGEAATLFNAVNGVDDKGIDCTRAP
ncbi:heat shock protein HslJ [Pararhizobium capsulatum DSM 1112]|uniref:Heat shock protein HslJ n=1 Tax=Pararhizobium capsulatum DSM 1112 TaxID=1121113 RepID=A0ABU0BVG6_9HYPH|nr:META domain-containing protein [Pararhizobium capsulatum]MDQ0321977.1 heat shock protein HslJ [Pararhizobium capsulatum DSM 1112]